MADSPRPHTADQTCDDLIEFLVVRDREPAAASPEGFSPEFEAYLRTLKPLFSTPRIEWPEEPESSTTKAPRFVRRGFWAKLLHFARSGLVPFVRRQP